MTICLWFSYVYIFLTIYIYVRMLLVCIVYAHLYVCVYYVCMYYVCPFVCFIHNRTINSDANFGTFCNRDQAHFETTASFFLQIFHHSKSHEIHEVNECRQKGSNASIIHEDQEAHEALSVEGLILLIHVVGGVAGSR